MALVRFCRLTGDTECVASGRTLCSRLARFIDDVPTCRRGSFDVGLDELRGERLLDVGESRVAEQVAGDWDLVPAPLLVGGRRYCLDFAAGDVQWDAACDAHCADRLLLAPAVPATLGPSLHRDERAIGRVAVAFPAADLREIGRRLTRTLRPAPGTTRATSCGRAGGGAPPTWLPTSSSSGSRSSTSGSRRWMPSTSSFSRSSTACTRQ